ncbi:MAG: hypothetical protein Q4D16_25855 [Eubacteriales bacterium]|nr:hypothetical protein [Eubacteriales bacterium]
MKSIKKLALIMTCCIGLTVPAAAAEGNADGIQPAVIKQAEIVADWQETPADISEITTDILETPADNPDAPSDTPADTPADPPEPEIGDGWHTLENGAVRYYHGGKFVTGFQTIGKAMYYFDQQGYLLKNSWITLGSKKYRTDKKGIVLKDRLVNISKKTYYFRPDGTMLKGWKKFKNGKSYFASNGARVTGLKKIGKKSYYFNSKGIMQTGVKKVKNTTYYLNDKGELEARKVNTKYYDGNGKAMNKVKSQDFETLQRAKIISAKITTSKMTKKEKLKKCFDWVISKPYVTRRVFSNFEGWPAVYANDHFVLGGGNCFADAAAFAYLAKSIGYTGIYVCVDSDGRGGQGHSWAEIGGLVYDPLFAEAKNYSRNYGVAYGVYPLHPILHIAV